MVFAATRPSLLGPNIVSEAIEELRKERRITVTHAERDVAAYRMKIARKTKAKSEAPCNRPSPA